MQTAVNRFLCAVLSMALIVVSSLASAADIKEINHDTFASIAQSSMIVDVRTPEEFAQGHVPGAVNIPVATVADNIAMFGAKDTSIVLYCRTGNRVKKAHALLSNAGYNNLHHLEGDIKGWEDAGKEMEMPEQ